MTFLAAWIARKWGRRFCMIFAALTFLLGQKLP
jgi:hypothetical protein